MGKGVSMRKEKGVLASVRAPPRKITNRICTHKEMAHAIVTAEKCHNLPSTGWRPRKVGGVAQSNREGLRTRGANRVSPSLRAEDKKRYPGSAG